MQRVRGRHRQVVAGLVAAASAIVSVAVLATSADPFSPRGSSPSETTGARPSDSSRTPAPAWSPVVPPLSSQAPVEALVAEPAAAVAAPAATLPVPSPSDDPAELGRHVAPSVVRTPTHVVSPSEAAISASRAPVSVPVPVDFGVGTLNVLGSQHRSGGTTRAAALAGAIEGRDVDLVGLQEVQSDQLAVFETELPDYGFWPARALGTQGLRLQIAYRAQLFELVDGGWITTVFDHMQRPVPWARLRERATGRELYVVDLHNSPGVQAADRHAAVTEEIALLTRLRATGLPVVVVGDLNDRTQSACRLAAAGGLVGSDGLSGAGGCRAGTGPQRIDHVLASAGVLLTSHVVDDAPPIDTATDHSFVHARATLVAAPETP